MSRSEEAHSRSADSPFPTASRSRSSRARDGQRAQGRAAGADRADITVEQEDGADRHPPDRPRRAPGAARPHRSLIANMVEGVTDGFEKRSRSRAWATARSSRASNVELGARLLAPGREVSGAGRASSSRCPQPTEIVVRGISKQAVGEMAANIRKQPPAGALQGQGHPLRGRARRPEGRQARMSAPPEHRRPSRRTRPSSAGAAACAPRSAAPRSGPRMSVFRSNRGIQPQLIDDVAATRWRRGTWTEDELKRPRPRWSRPRAPAAARRARQGGRRRDRACSTAAATATTAA